MGDADGGDLSCTDPDETIDAVVPAPSSSRIPEAAPDYGGLRVVDRDHYVVGAEIAKGGMGRVLEARDRRLGRKVAIKELLPKNRDAARRFEREARITARLQHPAIIHVYEAGTWPGGEPFYAMTRVEGRSLGKVVAERVSLNERLGLLPHVIAAADALAYAHSQHVIHRDLKPSNVLVGEFGETVVIDWGVAKDLETAGDAGESQHRWPRSTVDETRSGSVVGTPAYMPPEQARGESVDERADVYALGALLYTLLVGHAPFVGSSATAVLASVKEGPPPEVHACEPGAPRDLVAIATKAMSRAPERRYANAGELAADLKRFQTGQLVAAHRYTARQLFVRWIQRRRFAVAIAAGAVVAVATIASLSVSRTLSEKARAEARRFALLEERGRAELLDGHAGRALAYLAGAARDGDHGGARGFLIAEASRPFVAELEKLQSGPLVAVAPDGELIATAGVGKIEIHRVDGTPELALGDHGRIRVIVWDADGAQLVAAGDDGVAWVWTRAGKRVAELHAGAAILDAAFDPSGRRLVTASTDTTATVWNLARGERDAVARCHDKPVVSARFAAAADRVVTASEDRTACVWDATTGTPLVLLRGHTGALAAATWAHNDRWIVTASEDGTARVWSAEHGKLVIAAMRHEGGAAITHALVSHDERMLLTTGSDGSARVWALPNSTPEDGPVAPSRPLASLAGHAGAIVAASFADDDSLVATGGIDRLAKIWDPQRGQLLATFEQDDVVRAVGFAAGHRLVTGGQHAVIWDAHTDKQRYDLDSPVHAIAITRDGTVAAGTDDSRITLVRRGDRSVLQGHLGRVLAVAFTPDGRTLVTAGEDPRNRPLVWDVESGTRRGELGDHATAVRLLAISPDGDTVATASGSTIELSTLGGQRVRSFATPARAITALTFAPLGCDVYAGTADGQLVARDCTSGLVRSWRPFRGEITALAFSRLGDRIVIATGNEVGLFGDGETGWTSLVTLDNPGEVHAVQLTADGKRVITAGSDGSKIWDAANGKLLATRAANAGGIEAIALDGDDTLWTASSDGSITAWDIQSDTRSPEDLARFVRTRDPWRLDDNDVIRRVEASDGQR
jgi:eukaryotic-like serine/threonine-protein kinase